MLPHTRLDGEGTTTLSTVLMIAAVLMMSCRNLAATSFQKLIQAATAKDCNFIYREGTRWMI
jgi:hypothetical protein